MVSLHGHFSIQAERQLRLSEPVVALEEKGKEVAMRETEWGDGKKALALKKMLKRIPLESCVKIVLRQEHEGFS